MEIKRASSNDLQAVADLLGESGFASANSAIDTLHHVYLAYTKNNELAGVGAMQIYGSAAFLHTLVVREAFRGQGFGYLLMKTLDHAAKSENIDEIYVLSDGLGDYFKRYGYESVDAGSLPKQIATSTLFQQCRENSSDSSAGLMCLNASVSA